jgi:SRSO17 transposase
VQLIPPTGRKRRLRPDQEPDSADAVLAGHTWRRVTWRHGCKGPLAARFAAVRVRVGDGATVANNRHLPGEGWAAKRTDGLVGEWRTSGERKYYLSNLPLRTSRRALVAAIKARWVCEQGHQQLKQELGLGHFEGRSWTGLHRHALMSCIAFAYLQHLRLAEFPSARAGENLTSCSGTATITQPAGLAPRHHPATVRAPHRLGSMSPLQAQVSTATSY